MGRYFSTKTFGHELGLSACFRQWRATHSHCSFLHGYALSFKFEFGCSELDDKNWVQDFGGLKELKQGLEDAFDHKTVVAADDPAISQILELSRSGVADVRVMTRVGCEAFAELAYDMASKLVEARSGGRVWVVSCEVREHGANSAIYEVGGD